MSEGISPESERDRSQTEEALSPLPPETQSIVRGFFKDVAQTILAQHTSVGNVGHGVLEVGIRVNPDHNQFYKDRFKEVLDKQVLNPHFKPQTEIKL